MARPIGDSPCSCLFFQYVQRATVTGSPCISSMNSSVRSVATFQNAAMRGSASEMTARSTTLWWSNPSDTLAPPQNGSTTVGKRASPSHRTRCGTKRVFPPG